MSGVTKGCNGCKYDNGQILNSYGKLVSMCSIHKISDRPPYWLGCMDKKEARHQISFRDLTGTLNGGINK